MNATYAPREFGKLIGRAVITLQRWDRAGILSAHRTPTGRRYYTHDQYLAYCGRPVVPPQERQVVTYCRVSSAGQKKDLCSQQQAVEQFCIASGRIVHEHLSDIGSGLNYRRPNFLKLMERVERNELAEIIIAHKDRLVRFGLEWFESFCQSHGCKLTVMNVTSMSPEAEMTQDLLSIVHCFSSRLYGLRKYKKQIQTLAAEQEPI